MDTFSEKELERLKKLKQLRQLLQTMFGSHIPLLIVVFVFILGTILLIAHLKAVFSPDRYEAQVILYYHPETTVNIPAENPQYVLQILSQGTLKNRFLDEISGGADDKQKNTRSKITVAAIERNRKVDRFDVRVSSRDKQAAVAQTNAFAEYCINAYIEDRTARLQGMEESLKKKYEDISEELRHIDNEKNELGVPLQSNALDKEFEILRQKLSDQRLAQTRLAITIGTLEKRCKNLEKSHADMNPELIANEKFLNEQLAALKKLDAEITRAEVDYTDQNPKVLALLSRRDAIRDRLRKFLDEKKINSNDFEHFEETAAIITTLKSVRKELEERRAEMMVLTEEIKESETNFQRYREIMPRLQTLNRRYSNYQESQKKLRLHLAEVSTLLPLIKNDLRISEQSQGAHGNSAFEDKKDIFVYVFSAISLTFLLSSLAVLLEFWVGKVSGAQELAIIPELRFLGTLPATEEMFESKRKEQMSFSTICHNFQMSDHEHHIVLAGTLPGGKLIPSLFEAFEWSYAMSGKKTLVIDMVLADNFDYEAYPPADTGIVIYSGGKGFLPVSSKHYLSPSEQMLLKEDMDILRNSYDLIFIRHSASLRSDRPFLDQIISLCDGAMFAVGAKKTPRKMLRQLIELQRKTALSVMTILSESPSKTGKHNQHQQEEQA